jgi:hypothetical protein
MTGLSGDQREEYIAKSGRRSIYPYCERWWLEFDPGLEAHATQTRLFFMKKSWIQAWAGGPA